VGKERRRPTPATAAAAAAAAAEAAIKAVVAALTPRRPSVGHSLPCGERTAKMHLAPAGRPAAGH